MKAAIIEMHEYLMKAGLSSVEADNLMARLLQEETADYIDFLRESQDALDDKKKAKELIKRLRDNVKKNMN